VPLIVIASPTSAWQTVPVHNEVCVASLIATVPLPVDAAVIVTTVTANVALIASAAVAVNVQGLVMSAAQEAPVQLTRWNPAVGVAVICMLSLTLTVQLLPVQAPGFVRSAAVTVPPAPAVAVIATVVAAKVALTLAAAVAANEHGLVLAPPVHVVPAQLARWNPAVGVAVICMLSLTLAVQLLPVQAPGFVRSAAVTVPPAPAVAVIVTVVAAKVAVALTPAWGSLIVQVAVACPAHEPLQPANAKLAAGDAVIVTVSAPAEVVIVHAAPEVVQLGGVALASLAVTEPLPPLAALTDSAVAACATGDGAERVGTLRAASGSAATRLVEETAKLG
jgi:hypothetical protein